MTSGGDRFVAVWQAYVDALDDALMLAGRENLVVLTLPPLRRLIASLHGPSGLTPATAHDLLMRALDDIRRCVREPGAVPDPAVFRMIEGASADGGDPPRTRNLLYGERELRKVLASAPAAPTSGEKRE